MRSRLALLILPLSLVAAAADRPSDPFRGVREAVLPDAGEDRWATIPWRTSLWEARQEAARQDKPILLWEMDGHPLGCT
jgi:hypothetical protein